MPPLLRPQPLVMREIEAGRLSLETPLSAFYPQLQNAALITIAQLLGHTSGLGEYTDGTRFAELAAQRTRRWTRDQVLGLIEPVRPRREIRLYEFELRGPGRRA
jgi:CubicO group peptidase (beta-lactamase class C family)